MKLKYATSTLSETPNQTCESWSKNVLSPETYLFTPIVNTFLKTVFVQYHCEVLSLHTTCRPVSLNQDLDVSTRKIIRFWMILGYCTYLNMFKCRNKVSYTVLLNNKSNIRIFISVCTVVWEIGSLMVETCSINILSDTSSHSRPILSIRGHVIHYQTFSLTKLRSLNQSRHVAETGTRDGRTLNVQMQKQISRPTAVEIIILRERLHSKGIWICWRFTAMVWSTESRTVEGFDINVS